MQLHINTPCFGIVYILSYLTNLRKISLKQFPIHISRSASSLVQTTSGDIPHPLDNVMITVVQLVFKHFKITYFKAGTSKWNLKKTMFMLALESVHYLFLLSIVYVLKYTANSVEVVVDNSQM